MDKRLDEREQEIERHITLNKQLLKDIDRAGKEIERLNNIIKEVREEIRILESNCDISDYQAQKLYQILDKGE